MAFETRQRGGIYYYRSVRRNGKVCKEYEGTGWMADAAATLDRHARLKQALARDELRCLKQEAAEEDTLVQEFSDQAELWTRIALLAAGYHRHKRGEWRKRRV